jgi:hypothetical protein
MSWSLGSIAHRNHAKRQLRKHTGGIPIETRPSKASALSREQLRCQRRRNLAARRWVLLAIEEKTVAPRMEQEHEPP